MKLKDILQNVTVTHWAADPELEITGLSSDTRETMGEGFLFVALSGFAFDGNRFIPKAMEKGAAAVITTKLRLSRLRVISTPPWSLRPPAAPAVSCPRC